MTIAVQTEELESDEVDCQWPEDAAPGTVRRGDRLHGSASAKTASLLSANVAQLRRFLRSVGEVVEALCSENLTAAHSGLAEGFAQPNSLSFSSRHCTLALPLLLGERSPHDLTFSADGLCVIVAYGRPRAPPPPPGRKAERAVLKKAEAGGLLSIWKIHRATSPWAIMCCGGTPACCLLPAAMPHLVVAGTDEGAVQLWDLREPGGAHAAVELDGSGDRLALRSPAYTTEGGGLAGAAHQSPITQIVTLPLAGSGTDTAKGGGDAIANLSIASIELEGTLVVWIVLESNETDALDLGQAVGGKHRLLQSGAFDIEASDKLGGVGGTGTSRALVVLPMRTLCLQFVPTDPSRFLLGTDTARIVHRSRYSAETPVPEAYFTDGAAAAAAAAGEEFRAGGGASGATSLAFCPSLGTHFLAGRADGAVGLYHVEDATPLLVWEGFASTAIAQVEWSPSRPTLFWAREEDGTVHIFDVTQPGGAPLQSTPVPRLATPLTDAGGAEQSRKPRFALSPAHAADATALPTPESARQRLIGLSMLGEDGKACSVELHLIVDKLGAPAEAEVASLLDILATL